MKTIHHHGAASDPSPGSQPDGLLAQTGLVNGGAKGGAKGGAIKHPS